MEALADKADTCVAEVARDCIEAGIGAVRARLRPSRRRTREQLDTLDEQRVEVHAGG